MSGFGYKVPGSAAVRAHCAGGAERVPVLSSQPCMEELPVQRMDACAS